MLLASLRFNTIDTTVRKTRELHSCCNSGHKSSTTTRHQYHICIFHVFQNLQPKTTVQSANNIKLLSSSQRIHFTRAMMSKGVCPSVLLTRPGIH